MKKQRIATVICVALLILLATATAFTAARLVQNVKTDAQNIDNFVPAPQKSEAQLMYEEAVAAGYQGDYLTFLEEYLSPETPAPDVSEEDKEENKKNDKQYLCDPSFSLTGVDSAAMSVVSIHSTFSIRRYNRVTTATSAGAGVIYSIDGDDAYIVTNYHVVYERTSTGSERIAHVSDNIEVWLYGNEEESGKLSATFVGGAIDYDVAVLHVDGDDVVSESDGSTHTNGSVIEASDARPVIVGDSDDLTIGDAMYAIGNPNAEGIAASRGIVSVPAEYITMEALASASRTVTSLEIRIDAAVNHGNSGGGLFNAMGQYVGTVNARSEEDGVRDFGYAIPGNLVMAIARNVIENDGDAMLADLGFDSEAASSRSVYDKKTGKASIKEDVEITSVDDLQNTQDSLQIGDSVLSVTLKGKEMVIERNYQLTILAFDLRENDELIIEIMRGDATLEITVTAENFSKLN